MKRLLATLFVTFGILGTTMAAAPVASAQVPGGDGGLTPICIKVNVVIFGTVIGTGDQPICLG